MNIQDLANSINGKLVGNDEFFSIDGFTGKITFLNDAHTGDIVIRESIDAAGVEIAFNKNIACLITPDPKEGTVEAAERLNFPLIIIDDIETAREYVSKMSEEEHAKEHVGLVKKVEEKIIGEESFSIGGITEKISSIGSNLTNVIDSSYEEKLTDINDLVESVEGKLIGNDEFFSIDGFTGKFTFLNDAHTGDIVIRHWINGAGVEMAFNKNIACLITQTPKEDAVEVAEKLNFPLIITDKIELANAYALSHTIEKYSPDSTNVVITGTNGKSTTSHLIYHILNNAGHHVLRIQHPN